MSGLHLGLIVNPIAGIGGRVGLKGSDGEDIQARAMLMGALPQASFRACLALMRLVVSPDPFTLVTYPTVMGENACLMASIKPVVIGQIHPKKTTPSDTKKAARLMVEQKIDILLFAGGDGTARDIHDAIGSSLPIIGIPAGVKIYSAVFATHPERAGDLVIEYMNGRTSSDYAEVLDIDEEAYRKGNLSVNVYGYLKTLSYSGFMQNAKSTSLHAEASTLELIASEMIQRMEAHYPYIIGPGTTTRAITKKLGLEKTLLGVDVILDQRIILKDASEKDLINIVKGIKARIIITPISGQGYILGRGNQQISPEVIRHCGLENLIIISSPEKIGQLQGRPLLVDTGDLSLDKQLCGYKRIITGYHEEIVYPVSAANSNHPNMNN
jgi:predicted polyphosphate/ATP-dependent NAD kinase